MGTIECIPVAEINAVQVSRLVVELQTRINSDEFHKWGIGEVLFMGMDVHKNARGAFVGDALFMSTAGLCMEIEGQAIYRARSFAPLRKIIQPQRLEN